MTSTDYHEKEFSVYRTQLGFEIRTRSVDTAEELLSKQPLRRFGP
jgi:hypothetical protein